MTIATGATFYVHKTQGCYTYRERDELGLYPVGSDYRPVVVIDPEDREQVERLLSKYADAKDALGSTMFPGYTADAMQAALREFANPTPPKPEEPTGLGAVVEDADGRKWARYDTKGDPQPWWCDDQGPEVPVERRYPYAEITAVRILSEGVQQP